MKHPILEEATASKSPEYMYGLSSFFKFYLRNTLTTIDNSIYFSQKYA